jgi:hypothetical protein
MDDWEEQNEKLESGNQNLEVSRKRTTRIHNINYELPI